MNASPDSLPATALLDYWWWMKWLVAIKVVALHAEAARTWTITRDGEVVTTVDGQAAVLRWFHRNHSFSMDHALRYEGYRVFAPTGQEVL